MVKTRYADIARRIAKDIGSGAYPVGSTLPPEPVLAGLLGVSRSTVRAALNELQQSGMVTRRKSLGTTVVADRPVASPGGYSQTLGSIDSLIQYAATTSRRIVGLAEIVADEDLASELKVKPGSRWLKISHIRGNREQPEAPPICWTDVYVPQDFSHHVQQRLDAHDGAISELVEEIAGRSILEIEQLLEATGVPPEQALELAAQSGSHALAITRRYMFGNGDVAEISKSLHPADRFAYTLKLHRT